MPYSGYLLEEPQYRYQRPSSSLNRAGSHGPGGTVFGLGSPRRQRPESLSEMGTGSSGMRRVRNSSCPRAGSRETSSGSGRVVDGISSSRSPSEIAAGATMLSNGQRLGAMNFQSSRLVERQ